jgi:hypothetical protein
MYCVRTSTHRYWQTKWSWPWSESQRHWNMNKSKTKLDIGNGLDTKQFTWELGAMELLQKSCSCTLSGPQFLRFRSHLFNRFIWVTNGQWSSPQNVIKISTLFSFGQYSHGHVSDTIFFLNHYKLSKNKLLNATSTVLRVTILKCRSCTNVRNIFWKKKLLNFHTLCLFFDASFFLHIHQQCETHF